MSVHHESAWRLDASYLPWVLIRQMKAEPVHAAENSFYFILFYWNVI